MNSKNVYQIILQEFKKTENDIKEDVNIFKKWCEEQPHFPEVPSENLLRSLIVNNKFYIEKSKSRLDMYYSIRNLMPEIFEHHPLEPKIVHHRKLLFVVPLPKFVNNFEQICWTRLNKEFSPEEFFHEIFLVQVVHLYELYLQENEPILKYHFIFDAEGATVAHLLRFSIMNIKKFTIFQEKVYGLRVASIHYINVKPIVQTFLTKFNKFLASKLQARIIISQDTSVIFEKFGKSVLPKDYGGDQISLAEMNDILTKKYEEKKSFYDKIQQMKSNENLRPESLKNDDILGYYGTFKNINVD